MKYTSYPHYFAERVDEALKSKETFKETYLSFSPEERKFLLKDLLSSEVTNVVELDWDTDSAIFSPTDEDMSIIWWELVKNGIRRIVYGKEIQYCLSTKIMNFFMFNEGLGVPMCYPIPDESCLSKYAKQNGCDKRKERKNERGDSNHK